MSEYVIFSIDGYQDLHAQAKFSRYLDTLQAMAKLTTPVRLCIRGALDKLTPGFIMALEDYLLHVRHSPAIIGQRSTWRISGSDISEHHVDGMIVELGEMRCSAYMPRGVKWVCLLDDMVYMTAEEKW